MPFDSARGLAIALWVASSMTAAIEITNTLSVEIIISTHSDIFEMCGQ